VGVKLAASTTEGTLTVTNTGPPVPSDQVSRLLEPFQRAAPDRTATPKGLGLGLSIVADIAEAHGAGLEVRPQSEGGLFVAVSFPVCPLSPPKVDGNRSPAGMARPPHPSETMRSVPLETELGGGATKLRRHRLG
jgi:hypothetical protein